MTVKTIFKTLFTTMVVMVLSMLLLELFNVSIVSYQLRQISRMAARQACILFTSETYKGNDGVGGTIKTQDAIAFDGSTYVSGDFYRVPYSPNSSEYKIAVWKKIYANQKFVDFCNSTPALNKYYTLEILKMAASAAKNGGDVPQVSVDWTSSPTQIEASVKASTAQMYKNNYYTTANIGIPYMDEDIVNRMYQWNLAQLLSNCNKDSIQLDDNGRMCINFRGFKIYADEHSNSKISNYDYKVYDVSPNSSNRSAEQKKLWEDLNIDATEDHRYLGARSDAKGMQGYTTTVVGNGTKPIGGGYGEVYDNWYVTSVGIEYSLEVNYEGITPLRKLIAYVFNNQVTGLGTTAPSIPNPDTLSNADTLSMGGFNGEGLGSGVVTSGKLTYTLDR